MSDYNKPEPLWLRVLTVIVIAALIAIILAIPAQAAALYQASDGRVSVILYDEPCGLDAVVNLPRRATWTENGKTFEGCYTARAGLVVGYFADRTVVLIPMRAFEKATEI